MADGGVHSNGRKPQPEGRSKVLKNTIKLTAIAGFLAASIPMVTVPANACGGFDGCSGGGATITFGGGSLKATGNPRTNAKNAAQKARSQAPSATGHGPR
jgi:hypothetical protein